MSLLHQRSSVARKQTTQRKTLALRKALAASILGASLVSMTGCSMSRPSLASLNPFSRKDTASQPLGSETKSAPVAFASTVVNGTKSAATKSRDTVVGWFKSDDELAGKTTQVESQPDPLRLDNKVEVSPEVFIANGRLWESTGNLEKAMTSYAQALEKDPDNADALSMVGRLHFRQGNHEQAVDFFSRAVKRKPDEAALQHDLGVAMSRMGNMDGASSHLTRALELEPGTSRYANSLASVRFDAGDAAGALDVLSKNNKPAVAHYNMAFLHYRKGQTVQASEQLNLAMKYEPQAAGDLSTRRAVDRSKQLLAQLQSPAGPAVGGPGTAIVQSVNGTPGVAPVGTAPSGAATTQMAANGQATTTPSTGVPATGVPGNATTPVYQMASTKMQPGYATLPTGTAPQVTGASSTPGTQPTYQSATYRMPSSTPPVGATTNTPSATLPAGTATPPATQTQQPTPTQTAPTQAAPTTSGPMTLPPGFNFPFPEEN
ncbi:tetratricopeptide repeat protein [Stieleria varia]|uniref:Photosystem I assembly protein Ycf3 n=1 Tax=Stieleria varia TaxID=2528005 RepID=A0A5C6AF77_9BACT|nr:tetratricopeptide repeat protein [Stieleria varia]TWT98259.1 photosystem I assembly protein Ycf3 [Stieleria varia]